MNITLARLLCWYAMASSPARRTRWSKFTWCGVSGSRTCPPAPRLTSTVKGSQCGTRALTSTPNALSPPCWYATLSLVHPSMPLTNKLKMSFSPLALFLVFTSHFSYIPSAWCDCYLLPVFCYLSTCVSWCHRKSIYCEANVQVGCTGPSQYPGSRARVPTQCNCFPQCVVICCRLQAGGVGVPCSQMTQETTLCLLVGSLTPVIRIINRKIKTQIGNYFGWLI